MPTPPYAALQIQINGGGVQPTGIVTAPAGASIQLSMASSVGVQQQRWEIFDYPTGFTLPAGWTADASNVFFSTDTTPEEFTLPALSNQVGNTWGKYSVRLRVNGNPLQYTPNGPGGAMVANVAFDSTLTDSSSIISVLSENQVEGLGYLESTQGDSLRAWVGTLMRVLRTLNLLAVGGAAFRARNVVTANVANLASYTVASGATNDNITSVAGDVVLLVAQTTAAQNGPYLVGTVAAGHAPLTRPAWWKTGAVAQAGQRVDVAAGSLFTGTTWKVYGVGAVIDTTDPQFYPERVTQGVSLGGGAPTGTVTITNVPIRDALGSNFLAVQKTPTTSSLSTGGYHPRSIVAGKIGTASVAIQACLAGGAINTADGSTLAVTITN